MNKATIISLGVILVFAVVVATQLQITPISTTTALTGGSVDYRAEVCIDHYDADTGEWTRVDCSHNVLHNFGRNITRDYLGILPTASSPRPVRDISVGNRSGGAGAEQFACGTNTNSTNEHTVCGLTRTQGSFILDRAYTGNWSVQNTFTYSSTGCPTSMDVNVTMLWNTSSAPGGANIFPFACNNFTSVTLQNNDQINVTWTIWVT